MPGENYIEREDGMIVDIRKEKRMDKMGLGKKTGNGAFDANNIVECQRIRLPKRFGAKTNPITFTDTGYFVA